MQALVPRTVRCRQLTSLPPYRCRLLFPTKSLRPPKLLQLAFTASRSNSASVSWQQQMNQKQENRQRCR